MTNTIIKEDRQPVQQESRLPEPPEVELTSLQRSRPGVQLRQSAAGSLNPPPANYINQYHVAAAVQRIQSGRSYAVQMQEDILTLQRTIGNRAVVQLLSQVQKQGKVDDKSSIHTIAAAGVQGAGSKLPHYDKIQASFGKHDVSHVQAYTGEQAAAASKTIGAEAYATGNKVAFASSAPSLHTVAHEATHVVQQQHGVQLKGGIGEVGDKYEQQADEVADAVVQGKSAENILGAAVPGEAAQARDVVGNDAAALNNEAKRTGVQAVQENRVTANVAPFAGSGVVQCLVLGLPKNHLNTIWVVGSQDESKNYTKAQLERLLRILQPLAQKQRTSNTKLQTAVANIQWAIRLKEFRNDEPVEEIEDFPDEEIDRLSSHSKPKPRYVPLKLTSSSSNSAFSTSSNYDRPGNPQEERANRVKRSRSPKAELSRKRQYFREDSLTNESPEVVFHFNPFINIPETPPRVSPDTPPYGPVIIPDTPPGITVNEEYDLSEQIRSDRREEEQDLGILDPGQLNEEDDFDWYGEDNYEEPLLPTNLSSQFEAVLFDLDYTLIDATAVDDLLRNNQWEQLKQPENLEKIALYPGVEELLQKLQKQGIKIGLVSNSEFTRCVVTLNYLGIDGYFKVISSPDKSAKAKPAPDIINRALTLLNVAGNNTLVVGDHARDIRAGQRANIPTMVALWHPKQPQFHEKESARLTGPTYQAESIAEIENLTPASSVDMSSLGIEVEPHSVNPFQGVGLGLNQPSFQKHAEVFEQRLGKYAFTHPIADKTAHVMADSVVRGAIKKEEEFDLAMGSGTWEAGAVGRDRTKIYQALTAGNLREKMTHIYNFVMNYFRSKNLNKKKALYEQPEYTMLAEQNYIREEQRDYIRTDMTVDDVGYSEEGQPLLSEAEKAYMGVKNGQDRLTWSEGAKRWRMNEEHQWVKHIRNIGLPLKAGPSAHTNFFMQLPDILKGVFNVNLPAVPVNTRLACIGYLVPIRAHSLIEILETARAYEGCGYLSGPRVYHFLPPVEEGELREKVCEQGLFPDELTEQDKPSTYLDFPAVNPEQNDSTSDIQEDYPIYHFTSIKNLVNIFKAGKLMAKNTLHANTYMDISNQNIQEWRANKKVPTGGTLHDYVPFYFRTRSPMLYAVQQNTDKLVYLKTSTKKIIGNNLNYVFSDGHAAMKESRFSNASLRLNDELSWEDIRVKKWNKNDREQKRRLQAEFLVWDDVPLNLIEEMGVYDERDRVDILETLFQAGIQKSIPLKTNSGWFFDNYENSTSNRPLPPPRNVSSSVRQPHFNSLDNNRGGRSLLPRPPGNLPPGLGPSDLGLRSRNIYSNPKLIDKFNLGLSEKQAYDLSVRQSEQSIAQEEGLSSRFIVGHAHGNENACLISSLLSHVIVAQGRAKITDLPEPSKKQVEEVRLALVQKNIIKDGDDINIFKEGAAVIGYIEKTFKVKLNVVALVNGNPNDEQEITQGGHESLLYLTPAHFIPIWRKS